MPDQGKNFLSYNWPAIIWASFILILCGYPGTKLPELTFIEWLKPDKIAHLIIFGIQSYLLMKGFTNQQEFPLLRDKAVLWSVFITIGYGALVEILQDKLFVQRSGDVRDAMANGIGALMGVWFFKRRSNSEKL